MEIEPVRADTRGTTFCGWGPVPQCVLWRSGAAAQDSQRGAVEHFIGTIVRQTTTACPLTSPGRPGLPSIAAVCLCSGSSAFRKGLAPMVLWARPSPDGRPI